MKGGSSQQQQSNGTPPATPPATPIQLAQNFNTPVHTPVHTPVQQPQANNIVHLANGIAQPMEGIRMNAITPVGMRNPNATQQQAEEVGAVTPPTRVGTAGRPRPSPYDMLGFQKE